jgi:hypothetical protein
MPIRLTGREIETYLSDCILKNEQARPHTQRDARALVHIVAQSYTGAFAHWLSEYAKSAGVTARATRAKRSVEPA